MKSTDDSSLLAQPRIAGEEALPGAPSGGSNKLAHTYALIAQAIAYLRAHAKRQPNLSDLAQQMGLSESHLQRLFSEWAGISPKRFLQYLTNEHAKACLRESCSVLDASFDTGLSSPGRLHDLMLACQAVTPGEYGSLGEGLTIRHSLHATPMGMVFIAATHRGVCKIDFTDGQSSPQAIAALREEWPRAKLAEDPDFNTRIAERMFSLHSAREPLHLLLKGTNFQIQVWQALLRIPYGKFISYGHIAQQIGAPSAARAVGNAVGANPIAVLIPCHRVIRETGQSGHYRWTPERKLALRVWETEKTAQQSKKQSKTD